MLRKHQQKGKEMKILAMKKKRNQGVTAKMTGEGVNCR
jgi:hypothetical protein